MLSVGFKLRVNIKVTQNYNIMFWSIYIFLFYLGPFQNQNYSLNTKATIFQAKIFSQNKVQ